MAFSMTYSSGPELTCGPATAGSVVDSMQWHDSASPPAVQSENATIAKSPLRSECGATAKGNLDATNLRLEFVPGDTRLAQPTVEKAQVGLKTADYMAADGRWSSPQSGAQFMASDCLQDGEVSGVRACHCPYSITNPLVFQLRVVKFSAHGARCVAVARDRTERMRD